MREWLHSRVRALQCAGLIIAAALSHAALADVPLTVESPDGALRVKVSVNELGRPIYTASFHGEPVLHESLLGLRFAEHHGIDQDVVIESPTRRSVDQRWTQPWGEARLIEERYNELAVTVRRADPPRHSLVLRIRVFDDGFGFRYEVARQNGLTDVNIVDELTEFHVPESTTAWWTPGRRFNRYEYLYKSGAVEDIEMAHSPLTMRLASGTHISIHEAALVDYAAFVLDQRRPRVLQTNLTPWSDGIRVKTRTPFQSSWRTVQVTRSAAELANSRLILNLNEPNVLGDVSWVNPGKYVGIWWAMHVRTRTWASGAQHGATTKEALEHIDFAADNGFSGVLIEGWNVGWDGDWFHNGDVFDFTRAYDDFDLKRVAAYARKRGVHLIGHHETSGNVTNYNRQMSAAFDLYQSVGVEQVKTGYVADAGDIKRVDENGIAHYEWHDGQFMVNEYLRSVVEAAKRRISINTHEPIKDTGLRRTYPNWLSREGARGQEFNAWGNPPNSPAHTAILPFTRLLAGPMDFTPGVFDVTFRGADADQRVPTTLAKQLALYVVIYSPVQMAADLLPNYAKYPDAFAFIRDVPVDWERSVALDGEVGEFVVMARQQRGGDDWYVGTLTNEEARQVTIALDFLEPDTRYAARIYRDGDDAHWRDNPYAFAVDARTVTSGDVLELALGAGGGAAISLKRLSEDAPE
ncbi:MAG: glycoside hydrolase family 97 protein [Pseudomonadota bacterium]